MTDKTKHISAADYRALKGLDTAVPKPKRKQKYKNKPVKVDGQTFPSQFEASVWCALKMQKARYRNVTKYPSVKLTTGVKWKIDFACDLSYVQDGKLNWVPIYVEAKGFETESYLLKLKLYQEFGDRPLEIWKGTAAKPFIFKTVIPEKIRGMNK